MAMAADLTETLVLEDVVYRTTQPLQAGASSAGLSAALLPDKAVLMTNHELSIVDMTAGSLLYHGDLSFTFFNDMPGSTVSPGLLGVPDLTSGERRELPLSVVSGGFSAISDDVSGAMYLAYARVQQFGALVSAPTTTTTTATTTGTSSPASTTTTTTTSLSSTTATTTSASATATTTPAPPPPLKLPLYAALAEYSQKAFRVRARVVAADPPTGQPQLLNAAALAGRIALFAQGGNVSSYEQAAQAVRAGAVAVLIYSFAYAPSPPFPFPPGPFPVPPIPPAPVIDPAVRSALFQPLRPNSSAADAAIPVLGLSHADGRALAAAGGGAADDVVLESLARPGVFTDVLIAADRGDYPHSYASPTSNASFAATVQFHRVADTTRAYRLPRLAQNFRSVFVTLSAHAHTGGDAWDNVTGALTIEIAKTDLATAPDVDPLTGYQRAVALQSARDYPLPVAVPSQERAPTRQRFMPLFRVGLDGGFVYGTNGTTRQCMATALRVHAVQPELGDDLPPVDVAFPTAMAFARQVFDARARVWRSVDGQAQPAPGRPLEGGAAACALLASPVLSRGSLFVVLPFQSAPDEVTARWFELDVGNYTRHRTIALRQWGDVVNAIFPAISVDRHGNAGLAATHVSRTQPAALAYTGRALADLPGHMAPLRTPIASHAVYDDGLGNAVNAWSPSAISVDPAAGEIFTAFAQYPSPLFGDVNNNNSTVSRVWTVGLASFRVQRDCVDTCDSVLVTGPPLGETSPCGFGSLVSRHRHRSSQTK